MPAAEPRRAHVKSGIDADSARKHRAESKVELRKAKKDDVLQKRRNLHVTEETQEELVLPATAADISTLAARVLEYVALGAPESHTEQCLQMVRQLRKLLSLERVAPIDEVVGAGLIPAFISLLGHSSEVMAFEAAWCVTNVASGSAIQCQAVVDAGSVPPLINLLGADSMDVKEQAVWALGNIAGDRPAYRNMILRQCGVTPLLQMIDAAAQAGQINPMRNATWVLSNLMRGKPGPERELIEPAIPSIVRLLDIDDEELLADACWALSYLTDTNNDSISMVVAAGAISPLMRRLGCGIEKVTTPAMRALCNVLTGSDEDTQAVIDAGFLQAVPYALQSTRVRTRKEGCWALSNVAAGTAAQVEALMSTDGLVRLVLERLGLDEFEVKKEALYVAANVLHVFQASPTVHNASRATVLVNNGLIAPLLAMLDVNDSAVIKLALDAVANLLAAGDALATQPKCGSTNPFLHAFDEAGGIDKLEGLQEHSNTEVYDKAVAILEKHFGEEDGEDENLAPNTTGSGFVFGAGTPFAETAQQGFSF
mmetsp:Transcript_8324/g.18128  ORF Transcript_8324/g.18128 Transcript_8324/m.18128 type:complete len:540 (+) Transcript_8324:113-1732(+)